MVQYRKKLLAALCLSVLGITSAQAAGQAESAAEPAKNAEAAKPVDIPKSADVVIIGAGAAGTAATMAAAEKGASVVLLEKQPAVGGTGNFAEGIFAANSSMQKRQGIVVTPDMAFKTIMEYSHWMANPYVVRTFVNRSADTIEWVKSKGIKFEYIGPGGPGGMLTWHVIDGPGHGRHLIKTFHEQFKNMKVTTLVKTAGKDLVMKDGKITGVIAEGSDGKPFQIDTKAVIIATGGYANNKEMLQKYVAVPDTIMVGNVGKDGDGIKMSWKAGAKEEGMGVVQAYRPGLPDYAPNSQMLAAARQPYLWVDKTGRRFTDESIVIIWPHAGNALSQAGGVMYSVFDDETRKHVVNDGIDVPIGEWVIANTKLVKFDDEFAKESQKNRGFVFKANTIDDLAKQMGVDPAVLKRTVEDNNRYAAQKRDEIFNKSMDYLRPVKTGPFYAVKMMPAALGTLGGVKINEKMEAVSPNGNPVPGLYVTGNDAAGMYGDTYDLLLGGGTFGFALNSGRMAGENALDYIHFTKK
ncbi:FAD-dependent oxidoreductase [Musicola paradisiaca]|uniref:Fumarate reductase/succinate dehydrogenase flavoprotein domain protein n=1 Tax=Musicola paradisiaca (strain Ech703) TaxID=579405 RepID=C6CD74_MUSP7|nr:FAD-dependent oxidoreductase [Musicola paradisiaca]ACS86945.1 fumarate reductase/succinate dehydrogenase flavoprotein domain protein [Musicola paradisiaca Ech703]